VLDKEPGSGIDFWVDITEVVAKTSDEKVRWYLEEYPRKPLLEQSAAAVISQDLKRYGRTLASQLQKCPLIASKRRSQDELTINVWDGSPTSPIQQHLWEILEDSKLWDSSLRFRHVNVQRLVLPEDEDAPPPDASVSLSSYQKVRILFIVARKAKDGKFIDKIDPRIVTKPAFDSIKKHKYTVEGEILHPPTWKALEEAISSHPKGHYTVIHFDMHGYVSAESGRFVLDHCASV
jgi:hypothetical protein